MHKRLGKQDAIVILIIFVICIGLLYYFYFRKGDNGQYAVVTVDGIEYGTYSLEEEQVIEIRIDGEVTNILSISDGTADMTDAVCPDHLCVNQKAISKDGETIVCLPNKVVVTIESEEESDIDAVAN